MCICLLICSTKGRRARKRVVGSCFGFEVSSRNMFASYLVFLCVFCI